MAKRVLTSTVPCNGSARTGDHPTLGEDVSFDWATLAASQGAVSTQAILSQKDGHVFALEDRSSAAHTSWRRVLVRVQRTNSEVHVFGAEGSIVEDSKKKVCHGKQQLTLFLQQFGEQLYRSPQLRQHPRERSAFHSLVNKSASMSGKVTSVLLIL